MKIAIIIIFLIVVALVLPRLAQEKIDESIDDGVVESLHDALPEDEYAILNGVKLPGLAGKVYIAHVIVSRYGVFAIHTKNIYGWVIGGAANEQWTYSKGRGHKASIKNPINESKTQVKALQKLLKIDKHGIIPAVAFPDRTVLRIKADKNLIKFSEIADFVRGFEEARTEQFTDEEVDQIARQILDAQSE